jgi:hypothetical protein
MGPDSKQVNVDPTVFIRPLKHDRGFEQEVIQEARTQLKLLNLLSNPNSMPIEFKSRNYNRFNEGPLPLQDYGPREQATLAIAQALENTYGSRSVLLPDEGSEEKHQDHFLVRDHTLSVTPVNMNGRALVVERKTAIVKAGSTEKRPKGTSQLTGQVVEIKYIPEAEAAGLLAQQKEHVRTQLGR